MLVVEGLGVLMKEAVSKGYFKGFRVEKSDVVFSQRMRED